MFARNPLTAAILTLSAFAGASAMEPLACTRASVSQPKHRRAGHGPGTKAHQRKAAKRRNVQRNRSAHRG